jgi:Kinetochore complex Sim4 subunit Fta1
MPERLLNHTWTIRRVSPFSEPWDLSDLRELELLATRFLRSLVKTHGRVERDGTYVSIEWICMDELSYHLFFAVRIADQPTAQVVLCRGKSSSTTMEKETPSLDVTKVNSFAFCLVHGDRKTYEVILKFLETTVGCSVGNNSFRPRSSHLARILTDTIASMNANTSGPVEITFGMPRSVRNLDEFSISLPRTSFERFLMDLEFNRPDERQSIPVDEDVPSHFFKAIRLFILQIMRLDIQSFPINRVANNIVIFGVTGKLRLLNKDTIHVILEHIEQMILAQLGQGSTPVTKRKRVQKERGPDLDGLDEPKEKIIDVERKNTKQRVETSNIESSEEVAPKEGPSKETTPEDIVAEVMGGMLVGSNLDEDFATIELVAI